MKAYYRLIQYGLFILVIWGFSYSARSSNGERNLSLSEQSIKSYKILYFLVSICISLLFARFSYSLSGVQASLDRANYARNFAVDKTYRWIIGFRTFANIVLVFTDDPGLLFASVSFLVCILTLLHYLEADFSPEYLLILAISQYFIYSFYMLKQILSVAFGVFAITSFFRKDKYSTIIYTIIAVVFHESAVIIPIVLLSMGSARKKTLMWLLCITFFSFFLFQPFFTQIVYNLLNSILVKIPKKLELYLNPLSEMQQSNLFTIVKGAPFYLITLLLFLERNECGEKIDNYHDFLNLSIVVSGFYFISFRIYWLFRFSIFFYPAVFSTYSCVNKLCSNRKRVFIFRMMVYVSTVFLTFRYLFLIFSQHGGF